ncbi:MAG: hypothetical protein Q4E89_13680, partial [Eubacteriales bacterium]|nr:hypothetical protein [Eubacteriales bacterium]
GRVRDFHPLERAPAGRTYNISQSKIALGYIQVLINVFERIKQAAKRIANFRLTLSERKQSDREVGHI